MALCILVPFPHLFYNIALTMPPGGGGGGCSTVPRFKTLDSHFLSRESRQDPISDTFIIKVEEDEEEETDSSTETAKESTNKLAMFPLLPCVPSGCAWVCGSFQEIKW